MAKRGQLPFHEGDLDKIVEMMAQGASKTEVAAGIGIARDTFYAWSKKYPTFSDAIKRGEQLSEAWWESQGRKNLENSKFNAALWYMNMKNRFGWRDKPEETPAADFTDALNKLIDKLPG